MMGRFNAYNILSVYAVAVLLEVDPLEALSAISNLAGAQGRFEWIRSPKDRVTGIIDYAHTPDALKNVLDTVREVRSGNEHLITVVGCGGDRDWEKRPKMALIASELSDKVILTSDNPRNEDPMVILEDMKAGVPGHQYRKVLVQPDRREAVRMAVSIAQPGDIIMLAGKGHETYQEVKGVKHPFDDKAILQETFQEMDR
jgi:UDP-N-acetylmuramoyl-L-alanyl-D-glutamate--2,6-diaminopimelate ligase